MRNAFIKELLKIMEAEKEKGEKNTYLVTGDLGFSVFEPLKERYPDQYINAGISEQNMVGLSAGMALTGKNVFVYSIIPFLLYRPFEQVRNDICYHSLPVRLVGVGAGLAYSDAGSTHLPLEDLKVADAIPNLTVLSPSDPHEVAALMKLIPSVKGPLYMRLSKNEQQSEGHGKYNEMEIGKALKLREGERVLIVSTGVVTKAALEAADMLNGEKKDTAEVLEIHTFKPFDYESVRKSAAGKELVVSIEDNTGALSEKVAIATLNSGCKMLQFSLPDDFVHVSGTRNYLFERYGITAQDIHKKINEVID